MFRKIRSILVCLAFICSGLAVTGQLPTNLKITHFDGSNGFFSRLVRTFIRDDKGFIWIATSDGLFRYDGYSFRNYIDQSNDTLIHLQKNIFKLAISPDHKIWMGHIKGGISYFDPATGVTKNYPILQKGQPLNGVITMLVADDKNEIWFGIRRKGLWHLDPITGKVTHYENNAQQKTVIVDPDKLQDKNTLSDGLYEKDGNIWLATHDGLYQFNSLTKQLKRLECKQAIKPNFRDDDFTNITKDGDILWLGSWAGGLTKYHTIKKEWRNYKIDPKETQKGTTNIVSGTRIKSKNELWISSNDKGLGIFNKENETFQFYSDDPSHSVDIPSTLCSQLKLIKRIIFG